MSKEEGAKTVVYGGRKSVQQQYCGTVGGQSTDFSTIDSEVKTAGLKNNTLAPPDLCVYSCQHMLRLIADRDGFVARPTASRVSPGASALGLTTPPSPRSGRTTLPTLTCR